MTKSQQKKIDSMYEKKKDIYKVEEYDYMGKHKIELWRKNIKKGFYNFVTYLDINSEEVIKEAIIKDIINNKK